MDEEGRCRGSERGDEPDACNGSAHGSGWLAKKISISAPHSKTRVGGLSYASSALETIDYGFLQSRRRRVCRSRAVREMQAVLPGLSGVGFCADVQDDACNARKIIYRCCTRERMHGSIEDLLPGSLAYLQQRACSKSAAELLTSAAKQLWQLCRTAT